MTDHDSSSDGQAVVETALVTPMVVFLLLGIIQLGLVYQARLATEYAAFKAARSASVYRLDCTRMKNAALMALVPTIPEGGARGQSVEQRFASIARRVVRANRTRVGTPLLFVDYRLENRRPPGQFDTQLEPMQRPMRVYTRLFYFYEYRIPFAGPVMTRFWLATQMGTRWAASDPLMPTRNAETPPSARSRLDAEVLSLASRGVRGGYFTIPVTASWTMRMMSDPLPTSMSTGRCR